MPNSLGGDGLRLRQVVTNLAGNAIKFTEQGEVVLEVKIQSSAGDRIEILFSVRDTGIGISEEDREWIFAPFTQVDASTTRQHSGTGLGLAICRELIDMMGGRLWLESDVGQGATFHFTAWFDVLSVTEPEPTTTELAELPVLVVDDNPTNRTILHETLSAWSMCPVTVESGQAALEEFREAQNRGKSFPLVIVDALMPDMDGFTLIESLQSVQGDDQQAATVLMVSSADRQTFETRCQDLDVAAYLEKPVSQSELMDAVMTSLKGPQLQQSAVDQVRKTQRSLKILLAEDTPANQKVVRAILEKRGHTVDVANNGRVAVDLLTQGEFDVILMDVQMPTMDGLQATQAIRGLSVDEQRTIPIIAMTAHARREDRQMCLAAGMDAYIAKPIDAAKLIELVETVRHRESTDERDAAAGFVGREQKAQTDDEAPVIDLDAALARMGGDESLVGEMAKFFLDDSPQLLAEIERALDESDAETVRRAAHSLKGLASTPVKGASMAAQRLEDMARQGKLNHANEDFTRLVRAVNQTQVALRQAIDGGRR